MSKIKNEQYKGLYQLVAEQACKTPEHIAIFHEGQTLTYQQLIYQSNAFAVYLKSRGIGKGNKVAISMERSLLLAVVLLAIFKLGAIYVPLDPFYPTELLLFMLETAEVTFIVTQTKFSEQFRESGSMLIMIDIEWEKAASQKTKECKELNNDIAAILFTSGSTGKPKGVCLTHKGLINRLIWMRDYYEVTATDRILNKTSLTFDISIWEIFLPLIAGATLISAGIGIPRSSEELINLIKQEYITIIHFVPVMLKFFLDTDGAEMCVSLRHVFVSGDTLHMTLQERFFEIFKKSNCQLHNLYGPTEASIDVTSWQCQPESVFPFVPIGKPISKTSIYILNEKNNEVSFGEMGEIHIGGDNLATGYINQPLLTADKFFIHPSYGRLYKTGDLGRYLIEGNIEFCGRLDRQVKLGGYRVEMDGVENNLLQYSKITIAAVVVQEAKLGFKHLIAYLQFKDSIITEEASIAAVAMLRAFLEQKIPAYMIPPIFAIMNQIPCKLNGKIDRMSLPTLEKMKQINDNLYVVSHFLDGIK